MQFAEQIEAIVFLLYHKSHRIAINIFQQNNHTQRHGKFTKVNLYQQAGVQEYWIVDPVSKSLQVFVLDDGRYVAKDFGSAEDIIKVNVLEDCTIDLSQVFSE